MRWIEEKVSESRVGLIDTTIWNKVSRNHDDTINEEFKSYQ
jgi:hypothetical protein